jgi:hypothetical protein
VGRPTDYSIEVAGFICERLGNGESLRTIGLDDEMPSQATIYRWIAKHDEFREMYALAREVQADTLADEILDIADNSVNDWMEKFGDDGENIGWRENGEAINRSKLRIDSRKWLAAKLLPKKYSDRQLVGSDPNNPLPPGFQVNLVKSDAGR